MENTTQHSGYRIYWITWFVLLAITLGMLVTDTAPFPRWILLAILLVAMLVKAAFIAGNFMHLRFERRGLILIVAGSLLLTGLVLFAFLAMDARHVLEHSR